MSSVTLFSWGYWGWGNATPQLVEAVDAVERARGFKSPLFVDIRYHRNVLAKGFRKDAFERVVGRERYLWMQSLGNEAVMGQDSRAVKIVDPSAAEELLDLSLSRAVERQRLLFFCACEFPRSDEHLKCHRLTVTELVLAAARRRNVPIEIVEWPGGEADLFDITVPATDFKKVLHGRKSIPLGKDVALARYAQVPWASIVNVRSANNNAVPVLTGPARYSNSGWYLPVPWETADPKVTAADLKARVPRLRRDRGFDPHCVKVDDASNTSLPGLYEHCIYTIAHLDKLNLAMKQGGTATFRESRRWVTALKFLRAAADANLELPILLGDANDCSVLVCWGVLRNITIEGKETEYSFEGLRPVPPGHKTQELWLHDQNRQIAPGFIRPYALCRTPEFLRRGQ